MPEGFDLSIQLPELHVVTVHKLFGLLDCFGFVLTTQVNAILDVPIGSQDKNTISLHVLTWN
jgi:hypothetical protein